MRIVSWNVNGLRSVAKKGFSAYLDRCQADVLGLQETRVFPEQLSPSLREPEGWNTHFSPAERGGYSGVALYARQPWDEVSTSLDVPEFDVEGRIVIARFGRLRVVNGYFPNGSGKNRDNSRVPYKLRFYKRLYELLEPARVAGEPILVMGDFNIAHTEIDIARPRENSTNSGFLPIEREELSRWVNAGWVDTYRHLDPSPEKYTWWTARGGARARNVGWRIDYILASHGAMPFLKAASIHADVLGSDHCPVSVELDDAVVSAPKKRTKPSAAKAQPSASPDSAAYRDSRPSPPRSTAGRRPSSRSPSKR